MRDELTEELFETFPDLYKGHTLSSSINLMCFGFACGSGWFDILHRLSNNLTQLIAELPDNERSDYIAVQVKEKFGELRYYMTKSNEKMKEAIRGAAAEARKTCQDCGGKGDLRRIDTGSGGGSMTWLFVLCESCGDRRELRRIEAQSREPKQVCAELDD